MIRKEFLMPPECMHLILPHPILYYVLRNLTSKTLPLISQYDSTSFQISLKLWVTSQISSAHCEIARPICLRFRSYFCAPNPLRNALSLPVLNVNYTDYARLATLLLTAEDRLQEPIYTLWPLTGSREIGYWQHSIFRYEITPASSQTWSFIVSCSSNYQLLSPLGL